MSTSSKDRRQEPGHDRFSEGKEPALEIDPVEAARLLSDGEEAPLLVDVREDWEVELVSLEGESVWIPTASLGHRWKDLPQERRLLVYCHHGIRSLYAAQFLRNKGYPLAQSLRGGIEAWARQVEPGMRRY